MRGLGLLAFEAVAREESFEDALLVGAGVPNLLRRSWRTARMMLAISTGLIEFFSPTACPGAGAEAGVVEPPDCGSLLKINSRISMIVSAISRMPVVSIAGAGAGVAVGAGAGVGVGAGVGPLVDPPGRWLRMSWRISSTSCAISTGESAASEAS